MKKGLKRVRKLILGLVTVFLLFSSLAFALKLDFSKVTNIEDASVVISYSVDENTAVFVKYGDSEDKLTNIAYDIRGKEYTGKTFFVKLLNLKSTTKYYYSIISGSTEISNGDFTTAPELSLSLPKSSYGFVNDSNGKDASGSIVYVYLESKLNNGEVYQTSAEYADLVGYTDSGKKEKSVWNLNTGNFRTKDLKTEFSSEAALNIKMNMEVKEADMGTAKSEQTYSSTGSGSSSTKTASETKYETTVGSSGVALQSDISLPKENTLKVEEKPVIQTKIEEKETKKAVAVTPEKVKENTTPKKQSAKKLEKKGVFTASSAIATIVAILVIVIIFTTFSMKSKKDIGVENKKTVKKQKKE